MFSPLEWICEKVSQNLKFIMFYQTAILPICQAQLIILIATINVLNEKIISWQQCHWNMVFLTTCLIFFAKRITFYRKKPWSLSRALYMRMKQLHNWSSLIVIWTFYFPVIFQFKNLLGYIRKFNLILKWKSSLVKSKVSQQYFMKTCILNCTMLVQGLLSCLVTLRKKVSVFGIFLARIFSHFGV